MLSSYLFKIGMSKEDEQFYLISHFFRGNLRKSDVSSPSNRHKKRGHFCFGGPARHQRAELRFDLTGEEADHSICSDDHLLQAAFPWDSLGGSNHDKGHDMGTTLTTEKRSTGKI